VKQFVTKEIHAAQKNTSHHYHSANVIHSFIHSF